MRRWLVRILVCLILGAITTVAVAWGCAWFLTFSTRSNDALSWRFNGEGYDDWYVGDAKQTGALRVVSSWRTQVGISSIMWDPSAPPPEDRIPPWAGLLHPTGSSSSRVADARGWPTLAMWSGFAESWSGFSNSGPTIKIISGLELPPRDSVPTWNVNHYRLLPLRPIWPGFLIDTLFYAAIWFGVFFGFSSAKRFIRVRRGRCPRCGYDLRGNRVEQVSDLRGSGRLSEPHESPGAPARRAGETSHGSESRATAGCPECGWNRMPQGTEGLRDKGTKGEPD